MKVLTISGSLRKNSVNTLLAKSLQDLNEFDDVEFAYHDISSVPLFNEDDESNLPQPVIDLKEAVKQTDCLFIALPENNFLPSAAAKNVLDWLSRGHEKSPLYGKTIAIVSAAGREGGKLSQDAFRNSLKIMSSWLHMSVVEETVLINNFERKQRFDENNKLIDLEVSDGLKNVLKAVHEMHEKKVKSVVVEASVSN
jgi:chromate reductase